MKNKKEDTIKPLQNEGYENNTGSDGYPLYPVNEDIYNKFIPEENIDPEDLSKLKESNQRLQSVNQRLERVERQLIANNKGVGELRLSVMKLADRDKAVTEHDKRIRKIETVLAKNNMM